MVRDSVSHIDWYFEDIRSGTSHLTAEEFGVYVRLLNLYWSRKCHLSADDDAWLGRECGVSTRKFKVIKRTLTEGPDAKFTISEGLFAQKRADKSYENALKIKLKAEKNGRKGGEKTAEKNAKSLKSNETPSSNATSFAGSKESSNAGSSLPLSHIEDISSTVSNTELNTDRKSTTRKGSDAYAFAGRVIKLKSADYSRWAKSFHAIPDLQAELTARDDYLSTLPEADRNKWFLSTSSYLRNQHQKHVGGQQQIDLETTGGFAC